MAKKVKSKTIVELIKEGATIDKKNVEVTFYSAYNNKAHSKFPDALIKALKKSKKETFNIITEGIEIISLQKSKDVKSVKWA